VEALEVKDVMAQDASSLKDQVTSLKQENSMFVEAISEMYCQLQSSL
jgi:hypothetical protein